MFNLYVSALKTQHDILEREVASAIEKRADAEAKVQRLNDQLAEKEAALGRVREYTVNDYHQIRQMIRGQKNPCPYCLVCRGLIHELTAIASETDKDVFYCHECKQECEAPE